MNQVVKVARIGKTALSLDPRDFIFHSSYNTFKIIVEGTKDAAIPQNSTSYEVVQAHGLEFTPLVTAFCNDDATQVYPCGGGSLYIYGAKSATTYTTKLVKIKSDATNIKFYFDSRAYGADKTVHIRYFCLEAI